MSETFDYRDDHDVASLIAERDNLARELLTTQAFHRILEWLREPDPRPAVNAFTAGIERQIAYALEMDVLPEVKRLRHRAKLDSERIESLKADLVQIRGEVESWLSDND